MRVKLAKRDDVREYLELHRCTMPEAAKRIGIGYKALRGRLDNGQTILEIAANPGKLPIKTPGYDPIDMVVLDAFLAALGKTLTRACHDAGLSIGCVKSRLSRGWPIVKTFTTPARPMRRGIAPRRNSAVPTGRKLTYRMAGDPARVNKQNHLTATPPRGI